MYQLRCPSSPKKPNINGLQAQNLGTQLAIPYSMNKYTVRGNKFNCAASKVSRFTFSRIVMGFASLAAPLAALGMTLAACI
jgi:hypothetical protein